MTIYTVNQSRTCDIGPIAFFTGLTLFSLTYAYIFTAILDAATHATLNCYEIKDHSKEQNYTHDTV